MWSYMYFALHLDTIHPNDHNALEKYVYDNVRKFSSLNLKRLILVITARKSPELFLSTSNGKSTWRKSL